MAKRGFRDVTDPTGGLKNQVKFETGKQYHLKVAVDYIEEWEECWPCFPTSDGMAKRRFVGDIDAQNKNLAAIAQFKKENGLPNGLDKRDEGNWKPGRRYATIVAVGTEVTIKVTPAMVAKNPKLKGKPSYRKIQWDTANLKVWPFGIEVMRQLKAINNDADNIDALIEKGHDSESTLVTDVFALKLEKVSKGSKSWEVAYNVTIGKYTKPFSAEELPNLKAIIKELEDHTKPSPESEVEEFMNEHGGGGSSGMEAAAEEEVEEEVEAEASDDMELDATAEEEEEEVAPPPKKKAAPAKAAPAKAPAKAAPAKAKAKPAPEPEEEEEEAAEEEDDLGDLGDLDDLDI
jgi:hypothetical protein